MEYLVISHISGALQFHIRRQNKVLIDDAEFSHM